MSDQHTPEPWENDEGVIFFTSYNDDMCTEFKVRIANFNSNSDAYRAIVCVNKCAGLPQELLEQDEYSIKAELDSLDEQIELRMKAEKHIEELNVYIQQLEARIKELEDIK